MIGLAPVIGTLGINALGARAMARAIVGAANIVTAVKARVVFVALAPRVIAAFAVIVAVIHASALLAVTRIHTAVQGATAFYGKFSATGQAKISRCTVACVGF